MESVEKLCKLQVIFSLDDFDRTKCGSWGVRKQSNEGHGLGYLISLSQRLNEPIYIPSFNRQLGKPDANHLK
jgi:hypothetical protein